MQRPVLPGRQQSKVIPKVPEEKQRQSQLCQPTLQQKWAEFAWRHDVVLWPGPAGGSALRGCPDPVWQGPEGSPFLAGSSRALPWTHTAPRLSSALDSALLSPPGSRLGLGCAAEPASVPSQLLSLSPADLAALVPATPPRARGGAGEQLGWLFPQLPAHHTANQRWLHPAAPGRERGASSALPKALCVGRASDAARGTDGQIGHELFLPSPLLQHLPVTAETLRVFLFPHQTYTVHLRLKQSIVQIYFLGCLFVF